MLCCIFGGALAGLGMALTFAQGGSTGGTDIVALMINKYRSVSPGKIIVLLDIVILFISDFAFRSYLGLQICHCHIWFHNVCRIEFYAGYVPFGQQTVGADSHILQTI